MKKKLLVLVVLTFAGYLSYQMLKKTKNTSENVNVAELRETHKKFLENSPFKETLALTKKERKAQGIPPNKFNEREWELTMNPALGYPEPYKIKAIKESLENNANRVPGDGVNGNWIERGPNNVGGRTRALLFDPNDGTNSRVFAGAVSGGLWVNNDITTNNSWTRVTGVPGNLNVTSITVDPNDSNTWYLGTGESYTFGAVVGNGVYKTTDGGVTWTQVLSVSDFDTDQSGPTYEVVGGIHYINDVIAWDNNGTTEVYAAVATHQYGAASDPVNFLGFFDRGLYGSTDGGVSWTRDTVVGAQSPNDLEIDANGDLWMATTYSPGTSSSGGELYKRSQGAATTFSLIRTISGVLRTELEPSSTDANKFYVLCQVNGGNPLLYVTTDAFATAPSTVSLPSDPDTSVGAADFTRGQSFYDLVVEADPTDDSIVYLGGINVHRSSNSGTSWNTISHWSTGSSSAGSLVHADQHALVFRPGNADQAVLGHDGGVSFASSLSTIGNNLTTITDRITDYNATQFYHMGVAPTAFATGDYFLAGAQDNGTKLLQNADQSGPDASVTVAGGDGAFSFYDQVISGAGSGYLISNYVYNESIRLYNYDTSSFRTLDNDSNDNNGEFINPEALDSNLDLLYSNYSSGSTYRIRRYSNIVSGTVGRTNITNALLTGSPTMMTVSPFTTTSTVLIVGTEDGKVLRVTGADSGQGSWSDITGGSMVGSVSDVQFGQNEDEMFVTFHNYAVTSVWYTNDGGASWLNKEGNLPDMPIKCILQNPLDTNEVIVGTELGVWYTSDISVTSPVWNQAYNGMSDVKVTDLQVRDDNKVFACTFGRGIFSGDFTNNALAINEEELASDKIRVYPTVSDGNIFIKSSNRFNEAKAQVYDLNGRLAYEIAINLNNTTEQKIDLSCLSSGMYFLNISAEELNKTTRIVIK